MTGGIGGVILAGGLSSRMGGGDKSLLDLDGRPILAHVIARLSPQVDRLALNANGDPDRFAAFGLPVLADGVEGYAGPLAGVLAGMDWAAGQGIGTIATAAADTPFFPADLVTTLRDAASGTATRPSRWPSRPVRTTRVSTDTRPSGCGMSRSARTFDARCATVCARSSPGLNRTAARGRSSPRTGPTRSST